MKGIEISSLSNAKPAGEEKKNQPPVVAVMSCAAAMSQTKDIKRD
jgi:hypothetical protein